MPASRNHPDQPLLWLEFHELIGSKIVEFYGVQEHYATVRQLYSENAFAAIALAGFTIIPYRVFTTAAGAFEVDVSILVIASALSRSARFFLVATRSRLAITTYGNWAVGFMGYLLNTRPAPETDASPPGFGSHPGFRRPVHTKLRRR